MLNKYGVAVFTVGELRKLLDEEHCPDSATLSLGYYADYGVFKQVFTTGLVTHAEVRDHGVDEKEEHIGWEVVLVREETK